MQGKGGVGGNGFHHVLKRGGGGGFGIHRAVFTQISVKGVHPPVGGVLARLFLCHSVNLLFDRLGKAAAGRRGGWSAASGGTGFPLFPGNGRLLQRGSCCFLLRPGGNGGTCSGLILLFLLRFKKCHAVFCSPSFCLFRPSRSFFQGMGQADSPKRRSEPKGLAGCHGNRRLSHVRGQKCDILLSQYTIPVFQRKPGDGQFFE